MHLGTLPSQSKLHLPRFCRVPSNLKSKGIKTTPPPRAANFAIPSEEQLGLCHAIFCFPTWWATHCECFVSPLENFTNCFPLLRSYWINTTRISLSLWRKKKILHACSSSQFCNQHNSLWLYLINSSIVHLEVRFTL